MASAAILGTLKPFVACTAGMTNCIASPKYNPTRDDHAIFPETALSTMIMQGYTQDSGSDWLGYVYPNTGPVPVIL